MGKVLGIVAEYNPFHNGHYYHLQAAKRQTGSNYTVAVIGGNFTQRGSTSLIDKWSKAEMALANGVDLVLELPVLYAISSAENFAEGAIKILNSLKVVDYLAFGAETPDITVLNDCAEVLYREPKDYQKLLAQELKNGVSYPKARENALLFYLNDVRKYSNVLSSPNNILGIEYLKALKRTKSKIEPISIERIGSDYNSDNFNGNMASSTAIRNMVKNNGFDIIKRLMPENNYSILLKNIKLGNIVPDLSVFEKEIIYLLRRMSVEEIANLPDVSEGLEFTIKNAANSCNNLIELLDTIKSKRFTSTRLQRILLYALLGIKKSDMEISRKTSPYIRVLGFTERGQYLLSQISKANPKVPIITSVKKFVDQNTNKNLELLLSKDIFASNVYTIGYVGNSFSNLDFTHPIVKVCHGDGDF